MKWKEEVINRDLSVEVTHPKGEKTIWTCVEDNVIEEMEDHKEIGLRGFYFNLFE